MALLDKQLLAEIDRHVTICPRRKEGEGVTAIEYAAAREIDYNTAQRVLKQLAESGILEGKPMTHRGKRVVVYTRKAK